MEESPIENREKIVTKAYLTFFGAGAPLSAHVVLDENNEVKEFIGNIKTGNTRLESEEDMASMLKPLTDRGVKPKYSGFASVDFEDFLGKINIEKTELNKAIQEGRLRVRCIENGSLKDLEIF